MITSSGGSESPDTSSDKEEDDRLVLSVKALTLSESSAPVETSLRLLENTRNRALREVELSSNGAVFVKGLTSIGITSLARGFLEDMDHHVNGDAYDILHDKSYADRDNRPARGPDRTFSRPFNDTLSLLSSSNRSKPPCSYFHNVETLLFEEMSRENQICLYTEMAIGSPRLTFNLPETERKGLTNVFGALKGNLLACLTGSIDMMVVDRTTGAISVAEIKTKNLPRLSSDGGDRLTGYRNCPRLTKPDLLQAWFYAYVLTELYGVPVKDLFIVRTDVFNSKISTTRVAYEYVEVWGAEHLSLYTLKQLIRLIH